MKSPSKVGRKVGRFRRRPTSFQALQRTKLVAFRRDRTWSSFSRAWSQTWSSSGNLGRQPQVALYTASDRSVRSCGSGDKRDIPATSRIVIYLGTFEGRSPGRSWDARDRVADIVRPSCGRPGKGLHTPMHPRCGRTYHNAHYAAISKVPA
jgi:hypothetical protein